MERFSIRGLLALVTWLLLMPGAQAQEALIDESIEAQLRQAEQQADIDAVDDQTRRMVQELRRLESDTRRIAAYNAELEPVVDRQAVTLSQRQAALESAQATRETLPALTRAMVERLDDWIAADMPFLQEQRRARVASLESMLSDPALDDAERLDRTLSAWRAELDYGREMDAWRGMLDGEHEVDFLRLGRVGLYFLATDGREGGVWRVAEQAWQPLDDAARRELQKGLNMARDRRAPELLTLPVSQPLRDQRQQEGRS
ncbi:DUF3450 domain-containing protein [Halomonas korlensis]|uniref:DUF3450 domain-containing protein n=1 Tax=Halomonas korlensis TaxID=463301 RepID=A0A1I7KBV5_9GAMM|nr:DUF3450 domain-containing protein [Halomonas korlensis]SFU94893.1 Protein of unknown function [Halomonas korlensis]